MERSCCHVHPPNPRPSDASPLGRLEKARPHHRLCFSTGGKNESARCKLPALLTIPKSPVAPPAPVRFPHWPRVLQKLGTYCAKPSPTAAFRRPRARPGLPPRLLPAFAKPLRACWVWPVPSPPTPPWQGLAWNSTQPAAAAQYVFAGKCSGHLYLRGSEGGGARQARTHAGEGAPLRCWRAPFCHDAPSDPPSCTAGRGVCAPAPEGAPEDASEDKTTPTSPKRLAAAFEAPTSRGDAPRSPVHSGNVLRGLRHTERHPRPAPALRRCQSLLGRT